MAREMVRTARLRTLIATGLCLFAGAVLLPLGYRALLPVHDVLFWPLLMGHLIGAALMTLVVAIVSWVALWPATPYLDLGQGDPEPRGAEPREAKAAALSFPGRIATAGTAVGELAVAAGCLALAVSGQPPGLLLSLSLITAAMVALGWLLLYTLGRQAVAPLLHRLREVVLLKAGMAPHGQAHGVGSRLLGRLSYALLAVVGAGLCLAAVFASAYLVQGQDLDLRAQHERTERYISLAAQGLDEHRKSLLHHAVPLLQQQPEPVEVPVGMLLMVGVLALIGGGLALGIGTVVQADVDSLRKQVRDLCQAQGGQVLQLLRTQSYTPPRTAEAQQVAEALSRLLDRMRRLHVDSYLTIERTIDARRAKSQFLASMSHDLRSPLSSVLGFSELLTSGYEGAIPDEARRLLLHIHKTGRRLLRLLSEILDTAKVESQPTQLHPRRCSPAELLSQAVAEARRGRMHDEVPVILDLPQGLRPVFVDPLRFPQALAHLIGHVLDGTAAEGAGADSSYSPGRGIQDMGRVVVSAREESALFVVSVEHVRPASSGPDQERPSLPLGTVGLGLALPLARRLIALHGGTIEVAPGPHPSLRAIVPMRLTPQSSQQTNQQATPLLSGEQKPVITA